MIEKEIEIKAGLLADKVKHYLITTMGVTIDEANDEDEVQVGRDFTWKPAPKLELSATLNPEFGAVEADDDPPLRLLQSISWDQVKTDLRAAFSGLL